MSRQSRWSTTHLAALVLPIAIGMEPHKQTHLVFYNMQAGWGLESRIAGASCTPIPQLSASEALLLGGAHSTQSVDRERTGDCAML